MTKEDTCKHVAYVCVSVEDNFSLVNAFLPAVPLPHPKKDTQHCTFHLYSTRQTHDFSDVVMQGPTRQPE